MNHNTNIPQSLFSINSIQCFNHPDKYETPEARNKENLQIIWITKGAGTCYIDLKKFVFEKNQLFFFTSGQVYRFSAADGMEAYIISFSYKFFGISNQEGYSTFHGSLFQMFSQKFGIKINPELVEDLKDIVGKMMKEFNNFNLLKEEMLRRYLKIFLIYLFRRYDGILQTTRLTRNNELVQKFITLLDKHFKTEKMVAGYASLLMVTPNYLNEIIKKITGYSAGYHIRQRVILEAKRQAMYSDSCMKQIGYYLGFNDMAHFSKFFKTATGMNFTDFKKERMIISYAAE